MLEPVAQLATMPLGWPKKNGSMTFQRGEQLPAADDQHQGRDPRRVHEQPPRRAAAGRRWPPRLVRAGSAWVLAPASIAVRVVLMTSAVASGGRRAPRRGAVGAVRA